MGKSYNVAKMCTSQGLAQGSVTGKFKKLLGSGSGHDYGSETLLFEEITVGR